MSSPLIEGSAFTINPEAHRIHETGLRRELDGEYTLAIASFEAALGVLAELPPSVDVAVQSGRVQRDNGFTYARSAIKTHDITELDKADEVIDQAGGKTLLPIIQAGNTSPGPEPPLELSRKKTRELYAEHGATVSLAGRLATVRQVVFGDKNEDNPVSENYVKAHSFLKRGSNGYYRVSNAMVAARQELIDDHYAATTHWIGKGVLGLYWTAAFDIPNFKPAIQTFGSRIFHLSSHQAAVDSVAVKP